MKRGKTRATKLTLYLVSPLYEALFSYSPPGLEVEVLKDLPLPPLSPSSLTGSTFAI